MRKSDLMWIVGFYEGEGTAFCSRVKQYYSTRAGRRFVTVRRLQAGFTQKELHNLALIKRLLGFGFIRQNHASGFSWHTLSFTYRQARKFLRMILPHICSPYKRSQIVRALAADAKYTTARA